MPDKLAATEMTYTGTSSDMSYEVLMSSPSFLGLCQLRLALPRLAQQFLARILALGGDSQVLEGRLGLLAQLLRNGDLEGHQQGAHGPILLTDAPAGDPLYGPVGRAGLDPQGDRRAAVRRHLDVGAQGQLGDRDRDGHGQVVPVPAEHLVRLDVDPDVQVARLAAALTGGALAGQPDPLAVAHPGRDTGLDGPRAHRPPAAAARGARVVHHEAAAAAGLARLGEPEPAQVPGLLAGAVAVGADLGRGARLRAGAAADRARTLAGQPER